MQETAQSDGASSLAWSKPVKKTIYTLNIGDYSPEICALTYPLIKAYARKIGADFHIIRDRKFPDWPVTYEKLQIFKLAKEHGNDWNIFVDSDTLINPEMFDVTEHLGKDTVCHNGKDMAGIRWRYDQYFRRDGRHIGSCNWFAVASDWCLDLWRPLDDLTMEEAIANINITIGERNSGLCATEHLVDDYALSRNIARFALKVQTVMDICAKLGWRAPGGQLISPFLYHKYTISNAQKAQEMLALLTAPHGSPTPMGPGWGLMTPAGRTEYLRKFGSRVAPGSVSLGKNAKSVESEIDAPAAGTSPVTEPIPGQHIQGWMSGDELQWLHDTARDLQAVVEIGSWKGRSTSALCSSGCPKVYAVDHFLGSPEHQADFGFAHGWSPFGDFKRNVLDRFSNIELKKMSSVEAVRDFEDSSVDMVFLDGAYDYKSVLEDLRAWEPKARSIIAVHGIDYDEVRRAIHGQFQREPDQIVGTIGIFRKDGPLA